MYNWKKIRSILQDEGFDFAEHDNLRRVGKYKIIDIYKANNHFVTSIIYFEKNNCLYESGIMLEEDFQSLIKNNFLTEETKIKLKEIR